MQAVVALTDFTVTVGNNVLYNQVDAVEKKDTGFPNEQRGETSISPKESGGGVGDRKLKMSDRKGHVLYTRKQ